MFTKLKAISAIVIATYASPSLALGVGSIDMNSTMNEPLNATIELYGTEGMGTGQLIARMGSMQDFERAGVIREYFLDDVRFSVDLDNQGGGVIRLSTDNPVVEPYLNFVLDLRWPDGRILREYTALIDFMPLEEAAPVVTAAASPAKSNSTQASTPSSSARVGEDGGRYRVANGDTLWDIALQVRPGREYSPQQTMRAIVDNNPSAFSNGNINGLRAGSVLDLPSENQIASVDGNEARRWVSNQNNGWSSNSSAPVDSVDDRRVVAAPAAESEGAYLRLTRSDEELSSDAAESGVSSASAEGVETADEVQQALALPDQQLATTLEDLDRSERQNEELTARLAALEEQVQTMQRLMALKDQQLAKMQSPPAGTQDMLQNPTVLGGIGAVLLAALGWLVWSRRKPKDTEPGEMPAPVFAIPEKTPETEPQAVVEADVDAQVEAEVEAPLQEVVKQPSTEPRVAIPAAVKAPIEAALDTAEHEIVEALDSDSSPVEEALTEVDIYVAYGRAAKALELVKGIYAVHPHDENVQLKLLEVAAAAGAASEYSDVLLSLQGSSDTDIQAGLLTLTDDYPDLLRAGNAADDAPAIEDVADSNADVTAQEDSLDWDIGLEEGGAVTGTEMLESSSDNVDFASAEEAFYIPEAPATEEQAMLAEDDLSLDEDALAGEETTNETLKELEESASFDGAEMDFDSLELDDSAFEEASIEAEAAEELPDLEVVGDSEDFDLDAEALAERDAALDEGAENELEALSEVDLDDVNETDLSDLDDFDLDSLGDLGGDLSSDAEDDGELDLGDLSLDDGDDVSLDDMMSYAFPEDETDSLLDGTDDMTTKLDMARAYIEMGENQNAIEVLDEVIQGGTAEQQSEAAELKGTIS